MWDGGGGLQGYGWVVEDSVLRQNQERTYRPLYHFDPTCRIGELRDTSNRVYLLAVELWLGEMLAFT